ncbi:hypothetical protein J6590_044726 [Homalodisca vitripennis]|nr:hypothetical protein J6590_044726 [Homalodisca vitripennis]
MNAACQIVTHKRFGMSGNSDNHNLPTVTQVVDTPRSDRDTAEAEVSGVDSRRQRYLGAEAKHLLRAYFLKSASPLVYPALGTSFVVSEDLQGQSRSLGQAEALQRMLQQRTERTINAWVRNEITQGKRRARKQCRRDHVGSETATATAATTAGIGQPSPGNITSKCQPIESLSFRLSANPRRDRDLDGVFEFRNTCHRVKLPGRLLSSDLRAVDRGHCDTGIFTPCNDDSVTLPATVIPKKLYMYSSENPSFF